MDKTGEQLFYRTPTYEAARHNTASLAESLRQVVAAQNCSGATNSILFYLDDTKRIQEYIFMQPRNPTKVP